MFITQNEKVEAKRSMNYIKHFLGGNETLA